MVEGTLTTNDLFKLLEDRRVADEQRTKDLHARIGTVKDELYAEIEKSHKEILEAMREMKEDQRRHNQEECAMLDSLNRRVSEIEKWRWFVIGGAASVAFVVFGGIESLISFVK
jgi:putative NADH-flavin reductase